MLVRPGLTRSVGVRPVLDLNFLAGALDSRISFTRASVGTYFDRNGVLQTAAAGVPRFDYDPVTLQPRGLLIEEQRTNLLLWSEAFDNAAWLKSAASVSANVATAPDGTLSADKVVEDTSTAEHTLYRSCSFTSGTVYTYHVYAKAGERTQVSLRLGTAAFPANEKAVYTLTGSGSAQVVAGTATASIISVGNGWYRCTISQTADATVSENIIVCPAVAGATSYAGDGASGVYLWGAQLEAGAFPTSYIPTTTAAATRSADLASMPLASIPGWSASEGTVVVEFFRQSTAGGGLFEIRNGAGYTDRVTAYHNAAPSCGYAVTAASATTAAITVGSDVAAGTSSRIACAFAQDNFAATVNGSVASTDTSGAIPAGMTVLELGITGTGPRLNGHIRRLRLFSRRLPNVQLQGLTA